MMKKVSGNDCSSSKYFFIYGSTQFSKCNNLCQKHLFKFISPSATLTHFYYQNSLNSAAKQEVLQLLGWAGLGAPYWQRSLREDWAQS